MDQTSTRIWRPQDSCAWTPLRSEWKPSGTGAFRPYKRKADEDDVHTTADIFCSVGTGAFRPYKRKADEDDVQATREKRPSFKDASLAPTSYAFYWPLFSSNPVLNPFMVSHPPIKLNISQPTTFDEWMAHLHQQEAQQQFPWLERPFEKVFCPLTSLNDKAYQQKVQQELLFIKEEPQDEEIVHEEYYDTYYQSPEQDHQQQQTNHHIIGEHEPPADLTEFFERQYYASIP